MVDIVYGGVCILKRMEQPGRSISTHREPEDLSDGMRPFSKMALLLFTLSAVCLCVVLSFWQWQRAVAADQRYMSQQRYSQVVQQQLPIDPQLFQLVKIDGLVKNHYFLDNRTSDHIAGRELLLEVIINSSDIPYDRVLVNVGWQPRSEGLNPQFPLPKTLTIEGITQIPGTGFQLQDPLLDPSWPRLMQHVDLSLLAGKQHQRYYPALIYSVTPISGWVLSRVKIENKFQMHIGYSVQWALLGLVFIILFVRTRKTDKNES